VDYLQDDHVRPVLFAQPHVIHKEFEHVKGLLLFQVQEQHACYEGQALAVAHLRRAQTAAAQHTRHMDLIGCRSEIYKVTSSVVTDGQKTNSKMKQLINVNTVPQGPKVNRL
jgi:hypothetical protein